MEVLQGRGHHVQRGRRCQGSWCARTLPWRLAEEQELEASGRLPRAVCPGPSLTARSPGAEQGPARSRLESLRERSWEDRRPSTLT